jgi:NAD(P)-dependent dehydrogenase (short-subunit alcohol dehydrogenase family)
MFTDPAEGPCSLCSAWSLRRAPAHILTLSRVADHRLYRRSVPARVSPSRRRPPKQVDESCSLVGTRLDKDSTASGGGRVDREEDKTMPNDDNRPKPPHPEQRQTPPGATADMTPEPDHGEHSYNGNGRLAGKAAIITGADSGIGRAVAIAFAREGADILISYLQEHEDAKQTQHWVEQAGRRAILMPGDVADETYCQSVINRAAQEFGNIDILINNAAMQRTHESIEEISSEEWDRTFRTNIYSMFYLSKAALRHMRPGAAIVNTASINSKSPSPNLLAYATTKGAIANFTAGLAQMVAEKGVRVNCVAPGPIWTPLIPSTMPTEQIKSFGKNTPLGRAGQPAELAPAYVLLASDEGSYMSGAMVPVTGGRPML